MSPSSVGGCHGGAAVVRPGSAGVRVIASALADPTRRAILARLVEGEATVNELAAPFPMTAQAVGKHLRVLERAGLIERRRTAQLRPSRLRAVALKDAAEWLNTYREFWEAGFDRMDERLRGDG